MAADHKTPRLQLIWPRKEEFLLVPKDESGKPVWVPRTHPAASEVRPVEFKDAIGDVSADETGRAGDNLLFIGDSLDVLRILAEHPEFRREYRARVKCVYIDPPFNTGQVFEHYDDWMEHSTWLSFMRDRLLLIKDLLALDGSVWVHLDDSEVHRMQLLMDEVFGANNYAGTVVWRSSDNSNNDAKKFSQDHNTILVYSRQPSWTSFRLPATLEDLPHYENPDNDPRGAWFDGNPLGSPSPRENLKYDLIGPNGDTIKPPPKGWAWSRETLQRKMETGEIRYTEDGKGIRRRTYFVDHQGLPPSSVWTDVRKTGASRQAKSELKKLFPGVPTERLFSTPKPERFIERVVLAATRPGDIVLDCFAGSGTTAAVAHKLGRRWVTAEISESTVAEVTLPRLKKVVSGGDSGGISTVTSEEPSAKDFPANGKVEEFAAGARALECALEAGVIADDEDARRILKDLRRLGRKRKITDVRWSGGGGFRTVSVCPSMYEAGPDGLVLLSASATNGYFARAVAAQLGFDFNESTTPFCGNRGRMRLAVYDGAVGPEEVKALAAALDETERVTVVAKVVLSGAEETLTMLSKGSRIHKAPRDVLSHGVRRARRREAAFS